MAVSVLVVDDSGFFRRRLGEMINGYDGLEVVGTASNGREAIDMVIKLKPDVVTMDYEMPVMDGITAVRHIMDQCPTPILMFSSLTYEGARVTLDSLQAGAVDYLPKNFEEISKNSAELKQKLAERILEVSRAQGSAVKQSLVSIPAPAAKAPPSSPAPPLVVSATSLSTKPRLSRATKRYDLVAIGTSTGGPVALQNVLTHLPADFSIPIVLIQHMPATFTAAFAERLDSLCKIKVKEAVDGDILQRGVALLAPGGKQLMVAKGGKIRVLPGDERLNYKPCVDITFGSAANTYKGNVLAVVLTGMGSDGCEGARLLKQHGATIWAQDEKTSVIYGMPMAVAKANLVDEVLPLPRVGPRLSEIG
jgi:two-component system chemotaxis response regulator CheB